MKAKDWLRPAIAVGSGHLSGLRGELPGAKQVAAALQEAARCLQWLSTSTGEIESTKQLQ